MPDTPLNPDAIKAAWESNNGYTEGIRMDDVERMITAYLAVARPELQANSKPNQNFEFVNSVEELDAHDGVLTPMMHEDYVLHCVCGHELHGLQAEAHRAHVAEVLDKHIQEREAQMRQLIRDMTDPGNCWFDHHGGCQEHGYLDLKPGELCPHAEAKQLLGDDTNGRE